MSKIITPADAGFTRGNYHKWREQEKERRGFRCEWDGCTEIGAELHECIVTRKDAMGLPSDKWLRIFANCNMILLCRYHHEAAHAMSNSRTSWWVKMCGIYGFGPMVRWYNGFEWKVSDRRFDGTNTSI